MDKVKAFVHSEKKWIVAVIVGVVAGAASVGYHVPSAVVDLVLQAINSL
jgi:hypothetical protein